MTNLENQKIRNREKWLESERVGYDMSGSMSWCEFCEFSVTCQSSKSGKRCDYGGTSGDYIEVKTPCATAYNRRARAKSTDKKIKFRKDCIKKSLKILKNN